MAVKKREVCRDNNAGMVESQLPTCKHFVELQYCTRFVPLAHDYCPVSCGVCPKGSLIEKAEVSAPIKQHTQGGAASLSRNGNMRGPVPFPTHGARTKGSHGEVRV